MIKQKNFLLFIILLGLFLSPALIHAGFLSLRNGKIINSKNKITNIQSISCGDLIYGDIILTNDLLGCLGNGLIIGADDIILDCDGHFIEGNGISPNENSAGIYIDSKNNITIKNCKINEFGNGIFLHISNNIRIENNNENFNHNAIFLNYSSNIFFLNNILTNSSYMGVHFEKVNETIFLNNIIHSNSWGIKISNSYNNLFLNNLVLDNGEGIIISKSFGNILRNNSILKNLGGIYLEDSRDNEINRNNISLNNYYGIFTNNLNDTSFSENDFINNNYYGTYLDFNSKYNTFWRNNFEGNNINAYESSGSNENNWNLSNMGNFWDDLNNNPGYPYHYRIAGPGNGRDFHPNSPVNPSKTFYI